MQQLFIDLILVSIGTQDLFSRIPTEREWDKIYKIAEKQSLVGICFAGLQNLGANGDDGFNKIGMTEMQYLNWMGVAAQIQRKNELVNQQCLELQAKLKADGFRSCILKGQGVGALYGDLSMVRQSGDIDVWIDAPRESVIDYGMRTAPTKEFDQKHIHYSFFSDTPVEAHWIPVKRYSPLWDRTLKKYFDNEKERQFSNVVRGLCLPTADFQLVHQMLHVFGHYAYEGVGMRQIMDLFFAQKACTEGIEKVLLLFKKLGLMKFVAATQWVLKEVFLMSGEQLLCEPDSKEGQKLLDEILIGGNFGKYDKRNHKKGETFTQRFFRRWGRKFRMFRFDPLGTLLMPFSRIKLELWMRKVRRQYNV